MEIKCDTLISPRYMLRFRCIGGECEESCCGGSWTISLDKTFYQKFEKTLSRNQKSKDAFHKNIKRFTGDKASKNNYAYIINDANGDCGFLTKERLCSIQQDYGESILPKVCATYPRINLVINDRFERYGTFACPEVTRQCLLHEDAMVLDPFEQIPASNALLNLRRLPRAESFYEYYIDDIRSTTYELLCIGNESIETRLFYVVFFAVRTQNDFFKEMTYDPAAALSNHIGYIKNPESLAEIKNLIPNIKVDATHPTRFALNILFSCFLPKQKTRQHEFGTNIINTLKINPQHPMDVVIHQTYKAYTEHKEKLLRHYKDRIEGYFSNYALNFWLSQPYTESDNLILHCRKLLLRIAVIKFFFYNHPNIVTLLDQENYLDQTEVLDKAIVETVNILGKSFEHNNKVKELMEQQIEKSNVGLPLLASLLKY